jgi:hypothetical protein
MAERPRTNRPRDRRKPYPTIEQRNAQHAAVQEVVWGVSKIAGVKPYRGGKGNVRFCPEHPVKVIDGLRLVGIPG